MSQNLGKLALPLDKWRANFLLNVVRAQRYFDREGPFDVQLADRLSNFYYKRIQIYPGMSSAELVEIVMEAGFMWYLFFEPTFRIIYPPAVKFMKSLFDYPIIPRSSLKQFFEKLVLNMICYNHTPYSERNKLFTRASRVYLEDLLYERWHDSPSDFATPHYHICLDTIRHGQTILMVSPPPREQLTRLWTIFPDHIYKYLGIRYDADTDDTMYESVHGRRWEDYKALLLAHDPTDILLHPALKHLDWISGTQMQAVEPCKELPQSWLDFSHKRFIEEEEHLYLEYPEDEFQDLGEESRDPDEESQSLGEESQELGEEPQDLEEESQDLGEESQDLEEEPQDLGKEPQDTEKESKE